MATRPRLCRGCAAASFPSVATSSQQNHCPKTWSTGFSQKTGLPAIHARLSIITARHRTERVSCLGGVSRQARRIRQSVAQGSTTICAGFFPSFNPIVSAIPGWVRWHIRLMNWPTPGHIRACTMRWDIVARAYRWRAIWACGWGKGCWACQKGAQPLTGCRFRPGRFTQAVPGSYRRWWPGTGGGTSGNTRGLKYQHDAKVRAILRREARITQKGENTPADFGDDI